MSDSANSDCGREILTLFLWKSFDCLKLKFISLFVCSNVPLLAPDVLNACSGAPPAPVAAELERTMIQDAMTCESPTNKLQCADALGSIPSEDAGRRR
jgi:hypothetical protein